MDRRLKGGLARQDEDARADDAAHGGKAEAEAQMAADRGEFGAVDITADDVGRQDGDEVRCIGLDFAHSGGNQKRERHETGPAGHDIDEAGDNPAAEQ